MLVPRETQRKIFSLFVLCGSQLASWYPPMLRVGSAGSEKNATVHGEGKMKATCLGISILHSGIDLWKNT